MSLYDYRNALALQGTPFGVLLMAAVLRADSDNLARLAGAFPELTTEVRARYDAPGGVLPADGVPS